MIVDERDPDVITAEVEAFLDHGEPLPTEHYKPEALAALAKARQSLLTSRALLAELDEVRGRDEHDKARRALAEARCAGREEDAARLTLQVGDPDQVVDRAGTTPPQRRAQHLPLYVARRAERRAELDAQVAECEALSRRQARGRLDTARLHLQALDDEPSGDELTAEHMCPDAVHLESSHGYTYNITRPRFPCPAWPEHRKRWETTVAQLSALHDQVRARLAAEGAPVPPTTGQVEEARRVALRDKAKKLERQLAKVRAQLEEPSRG